MRPREEVVLGNSQGWYENPNSLAISVPLLFSSCSCAGVQPPSERGPPICFSRLRQIPSRSPGPHQLLGKCFWLGYSFLGSVFGFPQPKYPPTPT